MNFGIDLKNEVLLIGLVEPLEIVFRGLSSRFPKNPTLFCFASSSFSLSATVCLRSLKGDYGKAQ